MSTFEDVMRLADALYHDERECTTDAGIVGGHLHILLDDGNVSDSDLKFCLDNATADKCDTCIEIAAKMKLLSEDQRFRIHEATGPFKRPEFYEPQGAAWPTEQ